MTGYRDARWLRDHLDIAPTAVPDLHELARFRRLDGASQQIKAVGASANDRVDLVASSELGRFSMARAVWRGWRSREPFIVSAIGGMTIHKAERAFAAEFLAPSEGLQQLLRDEETGEGWVGFDRIGEMGGSFRCE